MWTKDIVVIIKLSLMKCALGDEDTHLFHIRHVAMLIRSIAVGKIVICFDLYYVLAFLHVGRRST